MVHISIHVTYDIRTSRSNPTTHLWTRRGKRMYSYYSFTTSALDGDEWSATRPGSALPQGKGPPGTYCTGSWVGLRSGLYRKVGNICCLCWGPNLDSSVVQSVARYYNYWATPEFIEVLYYITIIYLFVHLFYVYKNLKVKYFLHQEYKWAHTVLVLVLFNSPFTNHFPIPHSSCITMFRTSWQSSSSFHVTHPSHCIAYHTNICNNLKLLIRLNC
jgi:hypothetical protein